MINLINTTNLNLNKPELTDTPDITAINPNWDTIDLEIQSLKNNKLDKSLLPISLPANGGDAETLKGRDICTEVDGLKSTVVDGKTVVAQAINGRLGDESLSNTSTFDNMAWYINNLKVMSDTRSLFKYYSVNGLTTLSFEAKHTMVGIMAASYADFYITSTNRASLPLLYTQVSGITTVNYGTTINGGEGRNFFNTRMMVVSNLNGGTFNLLVPSGCIASVFLYECV